jgi:hypothetical protein
MHIRNRHIQKTQPLQAAKKKRGKESMLAKEVLNKTAKLMTTSTNAEE